ncbi:unnamed protein product, partial [marine sediment metagenome]
ITSIDPKMMDWQIIAERTWQEFKMGEPDPLVAVDKAITKELVKQKQDQTIAELGAPAEGKEKETPQYEVVQKAAPAPKKDYTTTHPLTPERLAEAGTISRAEEITVPHVPTISQAMALKTGEIDFKNWKQYDPVTLGKALVDNFPPPAKARVAKEIASGKYRDVWDSPTFKKQISEFIRNGFLPADFITP